MERTLSLSGSFYRDLVDPNTTNGCNLIGEAVYRVGPGPGRTGQRPPPGGRTVSRGKHPVTVRRVYVYMGVSKGKDIQTPWVTTALCYTG